MTFINNNYTQVPNEIFDDQLSKIGKAELKVLLIIIRRTLGPNKNRDSISFSGFSKLTGLGIRHIKNAIKLLQEKGFIQVDIEEVEGKGKVFYSLNIDESKESRVFTGFKYHVDLG